MDSATYTKDDLRSILNAAYVAAQRVRLDPAKAKGAAEVVWAVQAEVGAMLLRDAPAAPADDPDGGPKSWRELPPLL